MNSYKFSVNKLLWLIIKTINPIEYKGQNYLINRLNARFEAFMNYVLYHSIILEQALQRRIA
jgi:hypothetical protein